MANTMALGGGRLTVTATVGARPPGTAAAPRRPALAADDDGLLVDQRPRLAGDAPRGRPGPRWHDPDVDRLPGRRRRRPAAHRRGRPRRAARSVGPGPVPGGGPPLRRGYHVVLPNIRGSASYGAAWIKPQLGRSGEDRTRKTSTRRSTTPSTSAWRTPTAWVCWASRMAASWSTGSWGPRTGSGQPCPRTA